MKRKLLSVFLSLSLCAGLVPTAALAADTPTSHDISQNTLTISQDGSYTVTGTSTSNHIVVEKDVTATVTLNNVTITGTAYDVANTIPASSPIDLADGATLTLVLRDNSTNTLTGGTGGTGDGAPGIHVPDNATLIIQGGGSLTVTGGTSRTGFGGAGIGGNADSQSGPFPTGENCGTVIILAEHVTAAGGIRNNGLAGKDIGGGSAYYNGGDGQGIRPSGNNTYTVWGNVTLPEGVEIPEGAVLTGDGSLSSQLEQSAPGAPTLNTCTSTSVTLGAPSDAISGKTVEYGCVEENEEASSITEWQNDPTFNNLTPSTAYTFYARYAGDKFFKPSPASSVGLSVTTLPASPESSAVTIDYELETISYDSSTLEMSTSEGFTSGTAISSDSSIADYMGQSIYVRVKAAGGIPASAATEITIPARPDAPRLSINTGAEGVELSNEYYYNTTSGEYSAEGWRQGTGSLVTVQPDNSIYIYKAAVASGDDAAFKSQVQTLTAPARADTPNVPTIDYENEALSGTDTNMECRVGDTGEWVDCTADMNLADIGWTGNEMMVYFRTAATTANYASPASASLTIPARPDPPAAPKVTDRTDDSITITAIDGVEYRLGDGGTWQAGTGGITFSDLTSGQTYTIYARNPAVTTGGNPAFASAEASTQATTKNSAGAAPAVGDADVTDTAITLPYDPSWEYSTDGTSWSDTYQFTGLNPATAYTYYVRVAENEDSEASEAAVVTVYTAHAAPQIGEGYTIDYVTETVAATGDYEVRLSEGDSWTAGPINITPGGSFQARHTATEGGPPASAAMTNSVPARPAAPTTPVGRDRQISGVDATMEYRATFGTDQNWKDCGGHSVTDLAVGDYQVRYRAKGDKFASEAITVHVYHDSGSGSETTTYPPTVEKSENGAVKIDPTTPQKGDTVTITAEPRDRYKVDDITVTTAGGKPVEVEEQSNGTYTFIQPGSRVSIEVTFDVDLPFTDVPEDAWYIEGAKYVYANYIMSGTGDTTFSPSAPVSRGMVVQILYNLAGQPDVEGGSGFDDVGKDYWSADAIAWAVQNGVVGGYGDGTFRPDDDLTREQMVVILRNYAYRMGWDISATGDLSKFEDIPEGDYWAKDALSWAYGIGLLGGTGDTTMDPTGQASRAQIAVIMMRFCEQYMKS